MSELDVGFEVAPEMPGHLVFPLSLFLSLFLSFFRARTQNLLIKKPDRKRGDRSRSYAPMLMRVTANYQRVLIEETMVHVQDSPLGFPETQRQSHPEARTGPAHNRLNNGKQW